MKRFIKKILTYIIIWQSKIVIFKYKPKVIAITGSVGKTSTKEAIFSIISASKTVRMSQKSFYNEIGLPLTILGCYDGGEDPFMWIGTIIHGLSLIFWKHKYPEFLILEVGLRLPGDIKNKVSNWLRPDIVMVTSLPNCPTHIEFFNSQEELEDEKISLVRALKKGGLLILNHDDPRVYSLHLKSESRTVSFGINEGSTYQILYLTENYFDNESQKPEIGLNFKVKYEGNTFPVHLNNILGLHNAGIVTSALACTKELGFDLLESIKIINNFKTPPGRLSRLEGIKDSIIIDDSYNSSPLAQDVALNVLKEMKASRKIAVLGDMLELGKHTEEEHLVVGKNVSLMADKIILVGQRAKIIADGAIQNNFSKKDIVYFNEAVQAGDYLAKEIREGDLILVKGSQKMRMEKAVEKIMLDKDNKKELLCRQNKEWE
ncbi:MAG TPA: UDP-N-acetylmuramoyl-tripeptide--D-alanyl-D-alanine ligase [Candidatus Paceibacterota bacterium]|nr:UDP-N-acetylmuramoyl-tripeptide--D-alanyl-D-alanine ligase [Candidatus Paceibacterota bacterium]